MSVLIKVSVVIIFLDAEKFITESIESVLSQTYKNWELLLVDDGSGDKSTGIAKEYARLYPDKIRYLEHPGHQNRGKSVSRNFGVKSAKGEYIAFLDSDDIFLPEKLERQADILDQNPQAAMVYGPTLYWHGWTGKPEDISRDKIAGLGVSPRQILKPPLLMTLYLVNGGYIPCTCGLLVRKSILGEKGGWEENFRNLYEDQVFLAQIVLNHPVYVDDGSYDKYRQHPDMSSNLAIHKGEYHPDPAKTNNSQLTYFKWLFRYISQHKFTDTDLNTALKKRLSPYKKSRPRLVSFIIEQKCMPWFVILKWRKLVQFLRDKDRQDFIKQNIEIRVSKKFSGVRNHLNKRGLILMYHRITRSDFDPRQLSVSPAYFEEHVQVIKKLGHAVQMREMGKNLKRFSLGAKEIVLTFDDGYVDNFQNAKPVLEKYGIPATFFIVSGAVGSREEFFWDGLERTILAPARVPDKFDIVIDDQRFCWPLRTEGSCLLLDYSQAKEGVPPNDTILTRAQLYSALVQILGPLSTILKNEALKHIAQWAGQTLRARPDALPMSIDELVSLSRSSLFEIGAHTVNHPCLAKVSLARQEEEISRSKQDLENQVSMGITSFSYPHGSYSEETIKIVERLKFRNACTVVSRPVIRNSNPYLLPRFPVSNWNGGEFEDHLQAWLGQEAV
jgi:glycosyltransferase involved in cell wall biosynthesis